jgi:UDP-glucose 4-epimerase
VVDEYVRLGHRVWAIDNESSGNPKQINKAAAYTKLDIRDRTSLARYFKKHTFDVINHHAAQIDVRRSVADPAFDAQVNIIGLLNLLGLAQDARVKKFIFLSSGGTVYGECKRPAVESDPEVPMSPYGVAKLASEKYIKAFASLFGLTYTIFRYANVYGPRQDPHGEAGVVAIFSQRMLKDEDTLIFGTGKQTRDFVYVKDVARANGLALTKGRNEVLNIGTGVETSVIDLNRCMGEILGTNRKPLRKPGRAGELNRSVLNPARAKRVIGWEPLTPIHTGLAETIRFFASLNGNAPIR